MDASKRAITLKYLLWPTIKQIEVTKLDSDSLTSFADELICARHIFRIGTGIRWRNEKAGPLLSEVNYVGTWRADDGLTDFELG